MRLKVSPYTGNLSVLIFLLSITAVSMFENFIDEKIKLEKAKIAGMPFRSPGDIKKTTLLPFVKKFIVRQAPEELTANDVNFLLEKAVKLNFNYTIRPKWTLVKYLFSKYDSQRVSSVLDKLEVFLYYRFYTDLIAKFIGESTQLFISRKQVEGLVDETNAVLHEKLHDKINGVKVKNFFIQLFRLKYENDSSINLDSTVPFVFVRIFLEDKDFTGLLGKFRARGFSDDNSEISLKDIIKSLTGKSDEPDTNEVIESPVSAETEIVIDEKPAEVKLDESTEDKIIVDVENDDVKTVQDIQHGETSNDAPAIDEIYSKDLLEADNMQIKEEAHENINEDEDIKEEHKLPSLVKDTPDGNENEVAIKRLFTKSELEDIAKEVYAGSRHKMYDSFEELEKYDTWDKAIIYLKKIFLQNDVDMYHSRVLLYVDLLNDYFANKEEKKRK